MASTPTVKEACKLRPEVERGELFDVVKLHRVMETGAFEHNPDFVRRVTYPSEALKQILEAVSQKLTLQRHQGTFLVAGSYGTGKSHTLVVLHHIFSNAKLGEQWLSNWGLSLSLPTGCKSVVVSALAEDPELLWEPIFARLGRREISEQVRDFPSVQQVREAVAGSPTMVIVDELVPWYEALDERRRVLTRNFLQVLTEVADEPQTPFALVFSILREHSDLTGVLYRHEPYNKDLSRQAEQDKAEIVRFRLLESWDPQAAQRVAKAYAEVYAQRAGLDSSKNNQHGGLEAQITRYYPFHPELVRCVFDAYQACKQFQNMRGVLYLLGSVLRHKAAKAELMLTGDLDPREEDIAADLRQMSMELVRRCNEDLDRCQNVPYADRILPTILAYSFLPDGRNGADTRQVLLGTLRPGDNPNDVEEALSRISTQAAWYVHVERGKFLFREMQNLPAAVHSQAQIRLAAPEAKEEVVAQIEAWLERKLKPSSGASGWSRVVVFDGRAANLNEWASEKKLWDQKSISLVVSLRPLSEQEIFQLTQGGIYRNTAIWVTPLDSDLVQDPDIRLRAMCVVVCNEMETQASNSKDTQRVQEVQKERQAQERNLARLLQDRFGYWLKSFLPQDTTRTQTVPVRKEQLEGLNADALYTKVASAYGGEVFRDHFRARLQQAGTSGLPFGTLMDECWKVPGYPMILSPAGPVEGMTLLLQASENKPPQAVAEHEKRKLSAEDFRQLKEDERLQVKVWLSEFYPAEEPIVPHPPRDSDKVPIHQATFPGTQATPGVDISELPVSPPTLTACVSSTSLPSLQDALERRLGQLGDVQITGYTITIQGNAVEARKLIQSVGKLPAGLKAASYEIKLYYQERTDAARDKQTPA